MICLQFIGNFSLIERVCAFDESCTNDVARLKKILENDNDKKKKKNSNGGSMLQLSEEFEDKGTRAVHSITYSERNFPGYHRSTLTRIKKISIHELFL